MVSDSVGNSTSNILQSAHEHGPLPRDEELDDAGLDHSPVTPQEITAWNLFGFATEGFAGLGTAVFFPLILQNLADKEGFYEHSIYNGGPLVPCNYSEEGNPCALKVGGLWINTTSFVFSRRKTFLFGMTLATAFMGMLTLLVVKSNMLWLASLIFIFSNVTFSASYVFYYAWVPLLTRYHPDVIKAREDKLSFTEYNAISDATGNYISSRGFMWCYIGSVIVLIIGSGIAVALGNGEKFDLPATYPLMIGVAFSSLWMVAFLYYPIRYMKPRPGPPLPPGENYVLFSLKKFGRTFSQARRLGNLFLFLIGWFIYSDGFATITAVAILYFKSQLNVELPQLLLAAIITPLFGGIGSFAWAWIQRVSGMTTKMTLLLQATMYALLCIYGLLGFFTQPGTWGLRSKIEIFPLAAYHGFLLGGTQSSCRVMFSELLPPGLEAEFFSLYEITDKGSSWIGPLVTGLIDGATGNQRNAFFFLLVLMIIPMFIFWLTDMEKGKAQAHEYVTSERQYYSNRGSAVPSKSQSGSDIQEKSSDGIELQQR